MEACIAFAANHLLTVELARKHLVMPTINKTLEAKPKHRHCRTRNLHVLAAISCTSQPSCNLSSPTLATTVSQQKMSAHGSICYSIHTMGEFIQGSRISSAERHPIVPPPGASYLFGTAVLDTQVPVQLRWW